MASRPFRGEESYQAEHRTRSAVSSFLRQAGFTVFDDSYSPHRNNSDQIIVVESPSGERMTMRVKLCWPKLGQRSTYAASQIIGKANPDDWLGELSRFSRRSLDKGIDHLLIIQRNQEGIERAALFHVSLLASIWGEQKDMYERLINQGKLGRRKANPAINGSSPTLYLEDDNASMIETTIWNRTDVICVQSRASENEYDQTSGLDLALLGADHPSFEIALTRQYKRSDQVRRIVLSRARRTCERSGCGQSRDYDGFLDVHHILGIAVSDRTWNCIALCPNCHREAHCSPQRDALNREMAEIVRNLEASYME